MSGWLIGIVLALGGLAGQAPQSGDVVRQAPYSGRPLEGSVFVCSSDSVVTAGFRMDPVAGQAVQTAEVVKQERGTTWQIRLTGDAADIVSIAGTTREMDRLEGRFKVQRSEGMIMLSLTEGMNVLAITIDLRNSSFVCSGHNLTSLMNRVKVFSGSCRPYV